MAEHEHDHDLHLTIIIAGVPEKKEFPANMKVEEVIKKCLPPKEKDNWKDYRLSNRDNKELNPSLSLRENGVKDGDTLVLTRKDGGGGNIHSINHGSFSCTSKIS